MKRFDVFISYRRDKGGSELALLMYTHLRDHCGLKPFLDVKVLKNHTFGPQIMDAIRKSPVFLFLLSDESLDRCLNEDDWVRKEILYAVALGKQIIPVNPNGRFKTFPEGLPQEIYSALSENQQSEIHLGQLFEQSIEKMVRERVLPFFRFRRFIKCLCVSVSLILIACAGAVSYISRLHGQYVDQYLYYWERYLQDPDSILKNKADSCWNKAVILEPYLLNLKK